jgi:hypothetical protein
MERAGYSGSRSLPEITLQFVLASAYHYSPLTNKLTPNRRFPLIIGHQILTLGSSTFTEQIRSERIGRVPACAQLTQFIHIGDGNGRRLDFICPRLFLDRSCDAPVARRIVISAHKITERRVIRQPREVIRSVIRCGVDAVEAVIEFEDATASFLDVGIALAW